MRIGGGGSEAWMVLVPLTAAVVVVTVVLGGPTEALSVLERLTYDTLDAASLLFRR